MGHDADLAVGGHARNGRGVVHSAEQRPQALRVGVAIACVFGAGTYCAAIVVAPRRTRWTSDAGTALSATVRGRLGAILHSVAATWKQANLVAVEVSKTSRHACRAA